MRRTLHYTRKVFGLFGWKRAAFFLLQAVLHPHAFAKWFDFVETSLPESTPDILKIRLVMKPATRFVSRQFGVSARIGALKDYYTMLANKFSPTGIVAFMNETQLAKITGKSGKKYIVTVEPRVAKEGVLSLFFIDPEVSGQAPLAILMGLISLEQGKPVFTVGMLRGPGLGVTDGKQRVVDATRDLNGLRPKQTLVHAAAALAQWFEAQEMIAPSSRNEIPIKNWFKGYKIKADHTSFWEEFAKETASDGNYHLSLPLPRRDVADVQQKRRKDWLQRYEKIDLMSADIKKTLAGLSGGPHS
jgi:uncharacterized protein VirK/YbjX